MIYGSGGLGCFFGARLMEAGAEVHFLARGSQYYALRDQGLRIRRHNLDKAYTDLSVFAPGEPLPECDLVLLAVKMYALEEAVKEIAKAIGPTAPILAVQNGVEHVALIQSILPDAPILAAAVYIAAEVTAPAHLYQAGQREYLELASSGHGEALKAELAGLLESVKITVRMRDDLDAMLWRKFALVAGSSALCAYSRLPVGGVREDPRLRAILEVSIDETVAVARARGIALPLDTEELVFKRLTVDFAPDVKASQLADLERGKPLELEWLSGAVHRMGAELGIPTPVHSKIYKALLPYAQGQRTGERAPGDD